jgi:hypothetical protein
MHSDRCSATPTGAGSELGVALGQHWEREALGTSLGDALSTRLGDSLGPSLGDTASLGDALGTPLGLALGPA